VKSGKLKGTVEKGNFGEWTVLKDKPEALRRYVEKGGNRSLFPDSMKLIFERVK
jgi:hypothetical protein